MKNLKRSLFVAATIFAVLFVAGCTPSVCGFTKLAGYVTIDGKAEVGETLTANISQLKGLVGEVKYEWWQEGETIAISNATSKDYTLADENKDKKNYRDCQRHIQFWQHYQLTYGRGYRNNNNALKTTKQQ